MPLRNNASGVQDGQPAPDVPSDKEWTLESKRLALVPMTVKDAAELHALLWCPNADAGTDDGPAASVQDIQARIRRWAPRRSPDGAEIWLNWTLRLKHGQTAVGRMQATVTETRADMAWVIGPRFRNQGYATEAARCIAAWLMKFFKVGEVRAEIHPDNTASQRVAAKVGMRRTGERTDDGDEVWTCRR
ncbi:MAG: GNAT family N-acetyltransferase [Chloroflexota bacterium]|nr:GNAT family N-acetyltransferase [Chloroflexota bacterium]